MNANHPNDGILASNSAKEVTTGGTGFSAMHQGPVQKLEQVLVNADQRRKHLAQLPVETGASRSPVVDELQRKALRDGIADLDPSELDILLQDPVALMLLSWEINCSDSSVWRDCIRQDELQVIQRYEIDIDSLLSDRGRSDHSPEFPSTEQRDAETVTNEGRTKVDFTQEQLGKLYDSRILERMRTDHPNSVEILSLSRLQLSKAEIADSLGVPTSEVEKHTKQAKTLYRKYQHDGELQKRAIDILIELDACPSEQRQSVLSDHCKGNETLRFAIEEIRPAYEAISSIGTSQSQHRDTDIEVGDLPVEVPRYSLKEVLGQGGQGVVYRAQDLAIARHVAVKVLRPDRQECELSKQMFLRETRILGQLEHPSIPPVYDTLRSDDTSGNRAYSPFYATKLYDESRTNGGSHFRTLHDVVVSLKLNSSSSVPGEQLRDSLQHFLSACDGISFANERGFIHRDIKPSNIMVGTYGETLVIDWGLARVPYDDVVEDALDQIAKQCNVNHRPVVVGTRGFMSPEQAAGEFAQLGSSSEVYSLGAVLFFILTNGAQVPEPKKGTTVSTRPFNSNVSRNLDAVCSRAMAHTARDRYLYWT